MTELKPLAESGNDTAGDDRRLQLVAVNDNGVMLLASFRSLPWRSAPASRGAYQRRRKAAALPAWLLSRSDNSRTKQA